MGVDGVLTQGPGNRDAVATIAHGAGVDDLDQVKRRRSIVEVFDFKVVNATDQPMLVVIALEHADGQRCARRCAWTSSACWAMAASRR